MLHTFVMPAVLETTRTNDRRTVASHEAEKPSLMSQAELMRECCCHLHVRQTRRSKRFVLELVRDPCRQRHREDQPRVPPAREVDHPSFRRIRKHRMKCVCYVVSDQVERLVQVRRSLEPLFIVGKPWRLSCDGDVTSIIDADDAPRTQDPHILETCCVINKTHECLRAEDMRSPLSRVHSNPECTHCLRNERSV